MNKQHVNKTIKVHLLIPQIDLFPKSRVCRHFTKDVTLTIARLTDLE